MRLLAIAYLLPCFAVAQNGPLPELIPLPQDIQLEKGTLDLRCPWMVEVDGEELSTFGTRLEKEIAPLHPISDINCFAPMRITLRAIVPDTVLPDEWYALSVQQDGIVLTATTEEGLYRGTRTLVQLLEQGQETATLPCLSILDAPRFDWRGMHLDVCRHFFPVEFVKKYIDLLARYKMNIFHWHLTEDQGWRIEIKKYPKLTEIGAWRSGSQVGPYSRREYDSTAYGGFYTQEEIREVVAYAAERHITVVPEIEMPGHAMAALGRLSGAGLHRRSVRGASKAGACSTMCSALGTTACSPCCRMCLAEVMALFPSRVHPHRRG